VKSSHRKAPFLVLALAAASALPAASARAQSASDVLQATLSHYEQRMKGVDNYSLTFGSSMMNEPYTVYYEKKMVDGHPVFVTPEADKAPDRAASEWGNPYEVLPKIEKRSKLQGHAQVDGHDAFVVLVSDLKGLDFGQETLGPDGNATLEPKTMTLYVDSKDYLIRRMRMEGTLTRDKKASPIHINAHMTDYRSVKGLMQPYRMDITMDGLGGAFSEADKAEARKSMAALKERLDSMPADQRQIMEQMLKPQMDKMQQMLDSGSVNVSIQVQDVKVNEGPPKKGAKGSGSSGGTGRGGR
jgi:hypothetical protein